MSNIKFYQDGKWYDLYHQKIYVKGEWITIPSNSKIYFDGVWYSISDNNNLMFCGNSYSLGSEGQKSVFTTAHTIEAAHDSAFGDNFLLIIKDSELYVLGANDRGQIGLKTFQDYTSLELLTGVNFDKIFAGEVNSFIIDSNNVLYGTGNNTYFLITSSGVNVSSFTKIGDNFKYVSAGLYHLIGITTTGSLYCKGQDTTGRGWLGLGLPTSTTNVYSLTQITQFNEDYEFDINTGWSCVACGRNHTLGIHNGNLFSWGYNNYGQLGTGDNTARGYPTLVDDSGDWKYVDCGLYFSIAMKNDGSIYSCGSGTYGTLGLGSYFDENNNEITNVSSTNVFTYVDNGFDDIKCGHYHVVGRKGFDLYTWGRNQRGECGIGIVAKPVYSPTKVNSGYRHSLIGAGEGISFALCN